MTSKHCGLRISGMYVRLTHLILLVCASVFTEDFRGAVQSTGCYVAATRFRPHDQAVAIAQRGRRFHASEVGSNNNRAAKSERSLAAIPEQRQTPSLALLKADSAAHSIVRLSEAAAPTSAANAAHLSASGSAAGLAAGGQRPLNYSANLSSVGSDILGKLRQQAGATDIPDTKDTQTLLVQLQDQPQQEEREAYGSPERSASAVEGRGWTAHNTVSAPEPEGREKPAPVAGHSTAQLRTEYTRGVTERIVADKGKAEFRSVAPSLAPLPPPASPAPAAEQVTQLLVLPTTEPLIPSVTTAPQAASREATEQGAITGETALHWEELSRQHQQMLLSRNLTSVIKVFVDFTQPDYMTPWQMQPPRRCTGSAFVIEGRLLLTNGHLVDWQTRVLVRRHGNAKKFNSSVVAVAHDCDLALLTVDNEEFWEGLLPLAFGNIPQLRDTVTLLGYPTGGDQLSITEGVVSRVGVSKYVHSSYELLTVQIDAAINPGNSGGPALVGGKVVGVAFQGFSELQSIGYIVPYPVIRHFLNDLALHQRFTGFPTLGIKVANLENQGLREYTKLANVKATDLPKGVTPTGVIVTEVDSLRKERYLNGVLRLPFSSTPLPPDARIRKLLPEDPSLQTSPSSPSSLVVPPNPETAVSSTTSSLSFGGGTTIVPPSRVQDVSARDSAAVAVAGSLLSTSAANQQLPARSAPSRVAAGTHALPPAVPFTSGSQAAPSDTQPAQREHHQEEHTQQKKGEQGEEHRSSLPEKEGVFPTSEHDLLVPNVHFSREAAVDPEHVGLKVGDVVLAIDGIDVADDGTVPFRDMERVQMDFALMNRFNGECSKALVLRDGKLMDVLVSLRLQADTVDPCI